MQTKTHTDTERQEFIDNWANGRHEALLSIAHERANQLSKWGPQKHDLDHWNTILTEEVGEFAKAVLEGNNERAEKEAIQVAAVAAAIVQFIRTGQA